MPDRDLQRAASSIEKIRGLRVREPRDNRAAGAVGELRDQLEREIKQTGGMGEAWRAAAPDTVRDRAFEPQAYTEADDSIRFETERARYELKKLTVELYYDRVIDKVDGHPTFGSTDEVQQFYREFPR